jgi:hypothetical protein
VGDIVLVSQISFPIFNPVIRDANIKYSNTLNVDFEPDSHSGDGNRWAKGDSAMIRHGVNEPVHGIKGNASTCSDTGLLTRDDSLRNYLLFGFSDDTLDARRGLVVQNRRLVLVNHINPEHLRSGRSDIARSRRRSSA